MVISRTEAGGVDWQASWQNLHQPIGLLCLLTMLVGLLISRAALSIGMIGLVANAVFNL